MREDEPLSRCHDIAETLQYCLEGLKEVDRAFVSIDCKSLLLLFIFQRLTCCRYLSRSLRSCSYCW
jgi:hypothetical protein